MQLAAEDPRQITPLEILRPVHNHRMQAKNRQMDRARRIHPAARRRNLLQHQSRLGDPQAVPAELRWCGDAQPATLAEGIVELRGKLVRGIFGRPVVVIESGSQLSGGGADSRLVVG
jgi:hypothetical protein